MSINQPQTMREKYETDPAFRQLVEVMISQIHAAQFTPSELREAAIFASIRYESFNVSKMVFVERDTEWHLRKIERRLDRLPKESK